MPIRICAVGGETTAAARLEQLDQGGYGAYGKHKHAAKLDDNALLQQLQVLLVRELGGRISRRLDYRLSLFWGKAGSYQALNEIVRVENEGSHARSIAAGTRYGMELEPKRVIARAGRAAVKMSNTMTALSPLGPLKNHA